MTHFSRETLEKFGRSISLDWRTGCWLWTGPTMGSTLKYGQFAERVSGTKLAHRISWLMHVGPIPEGMYVCHKCDVPHCVNPAHLFLGSPADNTRDCIAKGRIRLRQFLQTEQAT